MSQIKSGLPAISGKLLFLLFFVVGCHSLSNKKADQNHLADAQSPYLLQHADNPVEWYPWGEEALRELKARTSRSLLVLAMRPAIGVMSWSERALRMIPSPNS